MTDPTCLELRRVAALPTDPTTLRIDRLSAIELTVGTSALGEHSLERWLDWLEGRDRRR